MKRSTDPYDTLRIGTKNITPISDQPSADSNKTNAEYLMELDNSIRVFNNHLNTNQKNSDDIVFHSIRSSLKSILSEIENVKWTLEIYTYSGRRLE